MMDAYRKRMHASGGDVAKRMLAVLIALAVGTAGQSWGYELAGGTGEPNDPYLIATAEQLLTADFNTPGTYFQLCNDIDMDRKDVMLFGSFRAHLDGAGFEIQNAVCPWGGSSTL